MDPCSKEKAVSLLSVFTGRQVKRSSHWVIFNLLMFTYLHVAARHRLDMQHENTEVQDKMQRKFSWSGCRVSQQHVFKKNMFHLFIGQVTVLEFAKGSANVG